jgi:putative transcription antitermination factor YqgF
MVEAKELLALDVGKVRTGIARASTIARIADPLMTVPTDSLHQQLGQLIGPSTAAVVVGLPRSMAGHDSDQTKWVRSWAGEAQAKYDVPFYFQDETLSTHAAESHPLAGNKKYDVDSMAAAIILQDFLNSSEADREKVGNV